MTYEDHNGGDVPTEFAALMKRYIQGDDAAFPSIYRRLAPRVRGQIRARLIPDDETDDLVQATFLRAHAARGRYVMQSADAEEGAAAWYCAIARNVALSHLRKRGREKIETGPSAERTLCTTETPQHDVESEVLRRERRAHAQALVHRGLSQLPTSQRVVVEMHKLQRLPMDEVARRLGITGGAVRVRAHRAYRRLAKLLSAAILAPQPGAAGTA